MRRPYFEGTRFTIRTNHEFLSCILNFAEAIVQLTRWSPRLSTREFDAIHRAGVDHQGNDALSCLQETVADTKPVDDAIPVAMIDTDTTPN